jgi:hypothetical protein
MVKWTRGRARPVASAALLTLALVLAPVLLLSATVLDVLFEDSGQLLGGSASYEVWLADLDQDGDLDAFVANDVGNRVWINQGGAQEGEAAVFQSNGSNPGLLDSHGIALADLDGDQSIDAFVANFGENEIWLNAGTAQFTLQQQLVSPTTDSYDVSLGLLDNDQFPDAFVANNGANEVWFNAGDGTMVLSQDELGSGWSRHVAIGDVNNDGAPDAYVANGTTFAQADELWINDGAGIFTPSDQPLDTDWNEGAALGDLDGDGDLDVFLATWFGRDTVWFNQGGLQGGQTGLFSESGQLLSENGSTDVFLIDLDADADLDAVVTKFSQPNEVWLNDGGGQFIDSGQRLGENAGTYAAAAGDLDLDQDVDLFFANFGANHVFLQGGLGLPGVWVEVAARSNGHGRAVLPWVSSGDALLPVVLGFPAPEPLDVHVTVESNAQTHTEVIPFATGATAAQFAVVNPHPTISETVTLDLVAVPAQVSAKDRHASDKAGETAAIRVNPLDLIFLNEENGPLDCLLCMMDWVLKQSGFEPSFWQLHHLQLEELRNSPSWSYYADLFAAHQPELTALMLRRPALLWQSFDVLAQWTPGIVQTDARNGESVLITGAQVSETERLLEALGGAASSRLRHRLQSEAVALDLPTLGGQSMNLALNRVAQRITDQLYLPAIMQPN